jgi:hypothetical protein
MRRYSLYRCTAEVSVVSVRAVVEDFLTVASADGDHTSQSRAPDSSQSRPDPTLLMFSPDYSQLFAD